MLEQNNIPLSLYVHIPWCVKKCPYCDFNSHEIKHSLPESQYIDALLTDVKSQQSEIQGRSISSIFIGGGTPSVFSAASVSRFLDGVADLLVLDNAVEITLEANPGTLDEKNFAGFKEAGVNRLSVGVQSFSNPQLLSLGRIHDAETAISSIQTAQDAGFENINIDLMFALPQQIPQSALNDVEQAIALHPTHISYYQLTLEPNTSFYRKPPRLPDTQSSWEIQQAGMALLAQHGYEQYEISAYAKPDFRCKHNLNYWQFGDYLGIGAGAHQKISYTTSKQIHRCEKPKHPQEYMSFINNENTKLKSQDLSEKDKIFEFMMNALRLKQGFTTLQFENHTGLSMTNIVPHLKAPLDEGLLIQDKDNIYCSDRGYAFLDDVLQYWLPESA